MFNENTKNNLKNSGFYDIYLITKKRLNIKSF